MITINNVSVRTVYRLLALTYLVSGSIAVAVSVIWHYNKEHIGLALLLGSIVAIFLVARTSRYADSIRPEVKPFLSNATSFRLTTIIWIGLFISIVCVSRDSAGQYYLPWYFFLMVALAAMIVSIQVLRLRLNSRLEIVAVLGEIIALSYALSASFLSLFPGPYGNDAPYHVGFISNILENGRIASGSGPYEYYPLYHLLFVGIESVADVSLRTSQLLLAFVQVAFLLFIFAIVRRIMNTRAGLMSMLVVAMLPYLTQPRYYFAPGSFSAIFFIFVLYALFMTHDSRRLGAMILLCVGFTITTLSHPLTPVILTFVLAVVYASERSLSVGTKRVVRVPTILLISILTILWWSVSAGTHGNVFDNIVQAIRNAFETVDLDAVQRATLAPASEFLDVLLYDFGFSLLVLLAVAGSLSYLGFVSHKPAYQKRSTSEALLICVMVLALAPVPFVLGVLFPQSLPDRWFPFFEVAGGAIAGAFLVLVQANRPKRVLRLVTYAVVLLIVFMSVTSPIANPNTHVYSSSLSTRAGLTTGEIQALGWIDSHSTGTVAASSKYLFLNYSKMINPEEPETYNASLVVVRAYDIERGFTIPLFGAGGKLLQIVYPGSNFNRTLTDSDCVFDNGSVNIYWHAHEVKS